jgi:hypothetical protein
MTCLLKVDNVVWIEVIDGQEVEVDGKIMHNSVEMYFRPIATTKLEVVLG